MCRQMTNDEYNNIKNYIFKGLSAIVSDDYVNDIVDAIIDDVIEDVNLNADNHWNYDDVKLAIGRVFCDKMYI